MRFKVQLVVCAEDGQEDAVHELTVLDKPCQRLEHLSLTLVEAKQLLTPWPQPLVAQQVTACVATRSHCDHCGKTLGIKGHYTRPYTPPKTSTDRSLTLMALTRSTNAATFL